MNIDEMEAGPELDATVGEAVMGLKLPWAMNRPGRPTVRLSSVGERPPPYSTDMASAWEVVEKIRTLTRIEGVGAVDLCVKTGLCCDGAFCEIFECSPMGYVGQKKTFNLVTVDAGTAPLAICRAALKAILSA